MLRRLSLIVLCACAFAAPALAAGASPGVLVGGQGVVDSKAGVRYVALPAGRGTLVTAVSLKNGLIVRYSSLAGRFGVALTTWTNTTGGLSPDGRTLVLQSVPQRSGAFESATRFSVLSTKGLRLRHTIVLRGDFSFDAISPDGRTLFLIEHVPSENASRYLVRALDLATSRLAPQPVVDKEEPNMAGLPVARTTRPDARWVYTLYAADNAHPFVHALDTVHRRAVCIDLKWSGPSERLWKLHLALRDAGRRLAVVDRSGTVETVDLAAEGAAP